MKKNVVLFLLLIPFISFPITVKDCEEQRASDTVSCRELSNSSASDENKQFCWVKFLKDIHIVPEMVK